MEVVNNARTGSDIFNDPFLQKHSCSQLANLSDGKYHIGIEKIRNQIIKDPGTIFKTSIIFYLTSARKN